MNVPIGGTGARSSQDNGDESHEPKEPKKDPPKPSKHDELVAATAKASRALGQACAQMLVRKVHMKVTSLSKATFQAMKEHQKTGESLRKKFALIVAKRDLADDDEMRKAIKEATIFNKKAKMLVSTSKSFDD